MIAPENELSYLVVFGELRGMVKVRGASNTPICTSDIELISPPRYEESAEVLALNGKASHYRLICGEQVSQFSLPTRLKF